MFTDTHTYDHRVTKLDILVYSSDSSAKDWSTSTEERKKTDDIIRKMRRR